ncbi:zinc finger CCCH domain-containing protein 44-like [Andrographis paniculata]|uniref:zinc finger CCCH domain-containing protein 44-like n=1 Tax=Andrographis paniculata TaxID=175694 RepID=UPI0021E8342D|nr:zinc finger CCCH domain-containing protein 44-like [Andrographis paniculata]
MDPSSTSARENKATPCAFHFSRTRCRFRGACYISHHLPGGLAAAAEILGYDPSISTPPRKFKTKLCHKYDTPDECQFGDSCHFAHGEHELWTPRLRSNYNTTNANANVTTEASTSQDPASITAKVPIDAFRARQVGGYILTFSDKIYHNHGIKLDIIDHETDPNQQYIQITGSVDTVNMFIPFFRDATAADIADMIGTRSSRLRVGASN